MQRESEDDFDFDIEENVEDLDLDFDSEFEENSFSDRIESEFGISTGTKNDYDDDEDFNFELPVDTSRSPLDVLMISGSDEVEIPEYSERMLDILRQSKEMTTKESSVALRNSNKLMYEALSKTSSILYNNKGQAEVMERVNNRILEVSPSFMDGKTKSLVKNRVFNARDKQIDCEQLYEECSFDYSVTSKKSNYLLFKKFVSEIEREYRNQFNTTRLDLEKNKQKISRFTEVMLENQREVSLRNLINFDRSKQELLQKAIITKEGIIFTCSSCLKEYLYTGTLISFLKEPNKGDVFCGASPIICPDEDCNCYNILPSGGLEDLTKQVDSTVYNLKPISDSSYNSTPLMYIPTYSEIQRAFPDIFQISFEKEEVLEEIPVDWEAECIAFRNSQRLFHSSAKTNNEDSVGVKVIAKIISSSSNDYLDLKERAIATLIQDLSNSRLSMFSKSHRDSLMIPYYYRDNYSGLEVELASFGFTKTLDSKLNVITDMEQFHKDYKNYCKTLEDLDERTDRYLEEMEKYSEIYSNLIITNAKLTEEMIENYLQDEKVFKVIDHISDLMIISNLAEGFLETFSPRKRESGGRASSRYEEGTATGDASYRIRKTNVLDINKSSNIAKSLVKFIEFFTNKCESLVFLSCKSFFLYYSTAPEFYHLVTRLCKSLLNTDYYEAFIVKLDILEKYEMVLESLKESEVLIGLNELIVNLPSIDLEKYPTKFSYYFEGEILEDGQEELMMEVYYKRKFAPRELIGETFTDKIDYYYNLSDTDYSTTKQFENFNDLMTNHYVLLKALVVMGNANPDKLTEYMLSRDLLFTFKDLNFKDLCSCLFINPDLASSYLEEEFTFKRYNSGKAKLVTQLLFKNKTLDGIFKSDDYSLERMRVEVSQYTDSLIKEFKGIEELESIVKEFLDLNVEED